MATPHISAKVGEIADRVIISGDPLRAKFIAENFLTDVKLVNEVRGMYCFTGMYNGKRLSVMGHGMGISSVAIYSYELFNFYGVERIIRAGSAGAYQPSLHLGDIIIAMGACDSSSYANQFHFPGTYAPIADFSMLREATENAERLGIKCEVGNIVSSEVFYSEDADSWKTWQKMGVLGVEMEASALYMNAARASKKALCICSISDSLVTHEAMDSHQRQVGFTNMMKLALETI
ncbi:MAG: purine-nucleoside phosphorylase [Alistipes sp.]|nr:purine-nucleoside phosphorylase [Candidatus Alistipes equi]